MKMRKNQLRCGCILDKSLIVSQPQIHDYNEEGDGEELYRMVLNPPLVHNPKKHRAPGPVLTT